MDRESGYEIEHGMVRWRQGTIRSGVPSCVEGEDLAVVLDLVNDGIHKRGPRAGVEAWRQGQIARIAGSAFPEAADDLALVTFPALEASLSLLNLRIAGRIGNDAFLEAMGRIVPDAREATAIGFAAMPR